MPYSQFKTIRQALTSLDLTLREQRFLPESLPQVHPGEIFTGYLAQTLPSAATGSEKVRSEGIIYPVLVEVRRLLHEQVSIFSGEDFTVDETLGLNGVVDFLISQDPRVSTVEAPVVLITEAKKADLSSGYGQCIAEMVAAARFNLANRPQQNGPMYGTVTSGTQWRFLMLEGSTVTLDLTDYPLPPAEQILSILAWMVQQK